MAKNQFRNVSGKLLNSTEREALSKLTKLHQPILKEMEKWKEQRETLENTPQILLQAKRLFFPAAIYLLRYKLVIVCHQCSNL